MKKIHLIFYLLLFETAWSQVSNLGTSTLTSGGATTSLAVAAIIDPLPLPPNAIVFDYDNAGNQIRRRYIYVANVAPRLNNPNTDEATKNTQKPEENLSPSDIYHEISYFPNPVKSELYLKWAEIENNDLQTIELYDLNGRMLRSYPNQSNQENATINFENYPVGYYNLMLIYSDGEAKTLKIVKQ